MHQISSWCSSKNRLAEANGSVIWCLSVSAKDKERAFTWTGNVRLQDALRQRVNCCLCKQQRRRNGAEESAVGRNSCEEGYYELEVRPEGLHTKSDKIVRSPSGHMIAVGSKLALSLRSVLNSWSNFLKRQRKIQTEPHIFRTLTVPINASFTRGCPLTSEPPECNTPTYIKTPFGADRSVNGSTNDTTSVSNMRVPSRCNAYDHISVHLFKTSSQPYPCRRTISSSYWRFLGQGIQR